MKPGNYPLTIYGGTSLDKSALTFTYKSGGVVVDLTGLDVRAVGLSQSGEVVFNWSTENGTLAKDPLLGQIWPVVGVAETAQIATKAGSISRYENGIAVHALGTWALEVVNPVTGRTVRLLQGLVTVTKGFQSA